MSGILRLANTGAGTGRSTLQSNASEDVTFSLPDTGSDSSALILTDDMHQISSVNWDGIDVTISNGDLNVDSGTFFVDESANRVGIGTTTPNSLLTLVGNNTTKLALNDVNTTNSFYLEQSSANARLQSSASHNLIIGSQQDAASGAGIELHTRDQPRLFVAAGGNIGIGTVSPSALLHVSSSSTGSLIRAESSGGSAGLGLVDVNGSSQILHSNTLLRLRCDFNDEIANSKLRLEVDNQSCLIAYAGQTIGIADGATTVISGIDNFLQVNRNSTRVGITLSNWSNNATGPRVVFGKSRSGAVNTYTRVNTSDVLGAIQWYGCDGTSLDTLSSQIASVATNSSNTVRTNLKFGVTGVAGFQNDAITISDRVEFMINRSNNTSATDMISIGDHTGTSTTLRYVCIRGTDPENSTSISGYSMVNWRGADGAARVVNNLYNFRAQEYTAGIGQTITTCQLFNAANTDVATNNYGFFGGIARSTNNNFNIYCNGTANNYMRNCLIIGDTPNPNYPDKLLVLEDTRASFGNNNPTIMFRGASGSAVSNVDIGTIEFWNKDNSDPGPGVQAAIRARTASNSGAGAYLSFSTCQDGAGSAVREVVRVTKSGHLQLLEANSALLMKSPNGTIYYVRVNDSGTLVVTN